MRTSSRNSPLDLEDSDYDLEDHPGLSETSADDDDDDDEEQVLESNVTSGARQVSFCDKVTVYDEEGNSTYVKGRGDVENLYGMRSLWDLNEYGKGQQDDTTYSDDDSFQLDDLVTISLNEEQEDERIDGNNLSQRNLFPEQHEPTIDELEEGSDQEKDREKKKGIWAIFGSIGLVAGAVAALSCICRKSSAVDEGDIGAGVGVLPSGGEGGVGSGGAANAGGMNGGAPGSTSNVVPP